MKLALIYPPFFHKKFNENLPTVDDEFGLFPHIGFAWVAAAAKLAGAEVRLFDAAAIKYSYEECLKQVEDYDPDVLCFAAHAVQTFRDMLAWAKRFKADTGLPILVGGYEAKVYPKEIMEHDCFDFLCSGEAISFIPPFVQAFENGGGWDKVPDLVYRSNGALKHTLPAKHIPFREHPYPDRSIFPNHLYYSQVSQRHNFTIGMSEVGCPYPCSFCSMRLTGFDARTPAQLCDEMEHDYKVNGIREIDWFDPIMLHDRRRMIDFSREIKRRKIDIIWSARARVDSISGHRQDGEPDEELIREIAESGCRRLFLGVESGDDDVLKAMRKKQVINNQKKVLDCLVAHGIRPLGFFMIGAPGDDYKTVEKTVKFACSLPLEYVQFTLTMIKPHTELEKEYSVKATGVDYWREYIRGTVEEKLLPTPWTELTRADQERLARYAYLRFYLRPRYIWRMIRKIESMEEFLRYARVAIQLILRPIRPRNPESVTPLQRTSRSFFAFVEAVIAAMNSGARHPVQSFGGGLKGAWRLAQHEWVRSGTKEEVAAPALYEDRELGAGKVIRQVDPATFPDRYAPVSAGALGVPRNTSVANSETALIDDKL